MHYAARGVIRIPPSDARRIPNAGSGSVVYAGHVAGRRPVIVVAASGHAMSATRLTCAGAT